MERSPEQNKPQNSFWKKRKQKDTEPEVFAPVEVEQTQPVEPEPAMPQPKTWTVELEREGALWSLWESWRAGKDWVPQPRLILEHPDSEEQLPLSETEIERETARIGISLEAWAAARIQMLSHETDAPAPDLDCGYFVNMSENRMAAWVMVAPPSGGGAGPSLSKLMEALNAAGIKAGLQEANAGWLSDVGGHYFELRFVAGGTLPTEGKDGMLLDKFARQRIRAVETDELGNVDYRAQAYFQAIRKGDVICDILPPEEGTPGLRVDGEKVEPRAVKPAVPPKGSNTNLSEDGAHLVAAMDGHIEFLGGVFQVRPSLEVQGDVDYSTGNIDFLGDVHIHGDVRENFRVRATGKVTIDGLVEGATVEADGDVVISKGVLGDNKALIKSKKLVRAQYLENCVVYSGDCTYADCIIASQIFSDSKISVTTGRGTVIGGCLTAAEQVECTVIGSKSGRLTEIILGQLPYIQEEFRDNEISLDAIRKEFIELEKTLAPLEGREGTAQEEKELSKARLRKSVLALKEDKITKRQEELKKMRPDLGRCRLICGTIFPSAKITIGSATKMLDSMWQKCAAYYDLDSREIHIL